MSRCVVDVRCRSGVADRYRRDLRRKLTERIDGVGGFTWGVIVLDSVAVHTQRNIVSRSALVLHACATKKSSAVRMVRAQVTPVLSLVDRRTRLLVDRFGERRLRNGGIVEAVL